MNSTSASNLPQRRLAPPSADEKKDECGPVFTPPVVGDGHSGGCGDDGALATTKRAAKTERAIEGGEGGGGGEAERDLLQRVTAKRVGFVRLLELLQSTPSLSSLPLSFVRPPPPSPGGRAGTTTLSFSSSPTKKSYYTPLPAPLTELTYQYEWTAAASSSLLAAAAAAVATVAVDDRQSAGGGGGGGEELSHSFSHSL